MSDAWDEVTPEEWEEALARQRWQERLDSDRRLTAYGLRTKCPRCRHENAIDLNFELKTILDRGKIPSVIDREIYAKCECAEDHPGRPAGETGCGQQSSIKFTIPAGKSQ